MEFLRRSIAFPMIFFGVVQLFLTHQMTHDRNIDLVELLLAHVIFIISLGIAITMVLACEIWREVNREQRDKWSKDGIRTYEFLTDDLEDPAATLKSKKVADISDDENVINPCPCELPESLV